MVPSVAVPFRTIVVRTGDQQDGPKSNSRPYIDIRHIRSYFRVNRSILELMAVFYQVEIEVFVVLLLEPRCLT